MDGSLTSVDRARRDFDALRESIRLVLVEQRTQDLGSADHAANQEFIDWCAGQLKRFAARIDWEPVSN